MLPYGAVLRKFSGSLTLPPTVGAEGIKATFRDGVMNLSMPKKETAKPKRIKVDVGQSPEKASCCREVSRPEEEYHCLGSSFTWRSPHPGGQRA
jgi:hypothetical protein